MSLVVKAHNTADTDKTPAYTVVDHSEVTFRDKELRSDNPEVLFHVGTPTRTSTSATDVTLLIANLDKYSDAFIVVAETIWFELVWKRARDMTVVVVRKMRIKKVKPEFQFHSHILEYSQTLPDSV